MAENCIFCKIINGEIPCKKVFEDNHIYAFEDINPVSPKHILVVPKQHISSLAELEDSNKALMGDLMLGVKKIAQELGLKEYRVVNNVGPSAGQSVFHIHMHILGGRDFNWPPG